MPEGQRSPRREYDEREKANQAKGESMMPVVLVLAVVVVAVVIFSRNRNCSE
jgi:hypothetical protein